MTKTISIDGMMCEKCVAHVDKALHALPGVNQVTVSLENKNAIVDVNDTVTNDMLTKAVEEAGYQATSIQ